MARLIVLGNVSAEIDVPFYEAPPPGTLRLLSALSVAVGGSALHTAVHATRLGVSTAIAGDVGDDGFGRMICESLRAEGVDVSRLRLMPGGTTSVLLICRDAQGRAGFLQHPGTSQHLQLPERIQRAPCILFHLAKPELIPGIWPSRVTEFARLLRANGKRLSLDAHAMASDRSDAVRAVKEHRHLLGHLDVLLAGEDEAKLISDRAELRSVANYFHELGTKTVVIKRGEKGAAVSWKGGFDEVPAVRTKPVDLRGAGDAFAGGFLAAYIRGLDPVKSARVGCTLGTLTIKYSGALTGTSDPRRLRKVLPALAPVRA